MFSALFAGLAFGAWHVLLGPDHVAAVAPFSVDARRRAWRVGLRWGLGHAAGVLAVGCVAYALVDLARLEFLSRWGERLIGVFLIGIGIWGLTHRSRPEPSTGRSEQLHVHTGWAMAVGVLHGLAGSAGVLGVLPALAMPSWLDAGSYLAGFALGSIATMVGVSLVFGLSTRLGSGDQPRVFRRVLSAVSIASILIGCLWLGQPQLASG
ncbi:MAG: High-affinity nickel transporter [Myxococcales bacterium]|nr:High-affinity nickel transporter [Myxococcales bacterium]